MINSQTPWSLYALLLATLSHSLITDPLLGFLLHCSTITWDPSHRLLIFCIFALWLLSTKVVKLLPHFALYPRDICFLPVTIIFGYLHGPIKLYAFFTLHVVSLAMLFSSGLYWQSRLLGAAVRNMTRRTSWCSTEGTSSDRHDCLAWVEALMAARSWSKAKISLSANWEQTVIMLFGSYKQIAININAISEQGVLCSQVTRTIY